ncbi:gamma carbonic anhydrase family protein [Sphingobium sp. IP1]|uniref:gamma carbonic anhydrase family protein n=1 Tax=Sphingobium sp. IP1 TaxID=2021637 RepID=UPI00211E81EE|nr:gamma carbonic anhydrase family protein [Sphingobium sp. IP1]
MARSSSPADPMGTPAYIDSTARLFGDVRLGDDCSLWPYAVVRSERAYVSIGRCASVQDHAMVHIGWDDPTIIGDYCTIGHRAVVHGCIIEPACRIGVGATIMERCVIGRGSIVAGHSFLPPDSVIPPHSLVMGTPGRVVRPIDKLRANIVDALLYRDNGRAYATGKHRIWVDSDMTKLGEEADAILAREAAGWNDRDMPQSHRT